MKILPVLVVMLMTSSTQAFDKTADCELKRTLKNEIFVKGEKKSLEEYIKNEKHKKTKIWFFDDQYKSFWNQKVLLRFRAKKLDKNWGVPKSADLLFKDRNEKGVLEPTAKSPKMKVEEDWQKDGFVKSVSFKYSLEDEKKVSDLEKKKTPPSLFQAMGWKVENSPVPKGSDLATSLSNIRFMGPINSLELDKLPPPCNRDQFPNLIKSADPDGMTLEAWNFEGMLSFEASLKVKSKDCKKLNEDFEMCLKKMFTIDPDSKTKSEKFYSAIHERAFQKIQGKDSNPNDDSSK